MSVQYNSYSTNGARGGIHIDFGDVRTTRFLASVGWAQGDSGAHEDGIVDRPCNRSETYNQPIFLLQSHVEGCFDSKAYPEAQCTTTLIEYPVGAYIHAAVALLYCRNFQLEHPASVQPTKQSPEECR